jgi:hypothetical protein
MSHPAGAGHARSVTAEERCFATGRSALFCQLGGHKHLIRRIDLAVCTIVAYAVAVTVEPGAALLVRHLRAAKS